MEVCLIRPDHFDAMDDILNGNGMPLARAFPPTYFVALDRGEVIGGGGYAKINPSTGWLASVAVAKHRKRTGVGSAVVAANLRYAAERGMGSMWLETYFWNSRFYESLGFEGIAPALVPARIKEWRTKKHCRFMANTLLPAHFEMKRL
jgi:GNAT superfamily N-acetyltransferase